MNALQLPFSYPQNAQHFAYCPYWFTYSPVFYAYVGYEALYTYPLSSQVNPVYV